MKEDDRPTHDLLKGKQLDIGSNPSREIASSSGSRDSFFRRNNRKEGLDWNLQMWFSPSRSSYLDFGFHKARPGRTGEVVGLRRAGLHVEVPNEIKEGSFMATSASLGGIASPPIICYSQPLCLFHFFPSASRNMLFVACLWNNPMESPILASGWSCLSGFLSSNVHSISEPTRGWLNLIQLCEDLYHDGRSIDRGFWLGVSIKGSGETKMEIVGRY